MAPVEVIDLLSSSDEEDQSPTKLLKSFQVRTNASTAPDQQRKSNGASSVGGGKSSSLSTSGPGDGGVRSQSGYSHLEPQTNVTSSGFKSWTLAPAPTFPIALSALPTVENTRVSFAPPTISQEAWNALGTPGRKLQQDFARIQRDLDTSRRQSEPERIARVDKAYQYQRQRRLSSGISQRVGQETVGSVAQRPLEAVTAAGPASSTHSSVTASAIAQPPRPGGSDHNNVVAANSIVRGQVSGIKRTWETAPSETVPTKRQRPVNQHTSEVAHTPGAQLLNTMNAIGERVPVSLEPETEVRVSSAIPKVKPVLEPPSLSPSTPVVPRSAEGIGISSEASTVRPQWTSAEVALLRKLKDIDGLDWKEIMARLPGRTLGAIKFRYYTQGRAREEPAAWSADASLSRSNAFEASAPLQQPTPPNSWIAPPFQQRLEDAAVEHPPHVPDRRETQRAAATVKAPTAGVKMSSSQYTAADNALLKRLKEVDKLKWPDIHAYFPERSLGSLQVHYSTKVKAVDLDLSKVTMPPHSSSRCIDKAQQEVNTRKAVSTIAPVGGFGSLYTPEELALIKRLREEEHLSWKDMVPYFNGRTAGSLQVQWYTRIREGGPAQKAPELHRTDSQDTVLVRSKRSRKSKVADGFISWADARSLMRDGPDIEDDREDMTRNAATPGPLDQQDSAFPQTVSRILRQREVGNITGARAWTATRCTLPDELKNTVCKDYTLQQYYHGTSGDVVGLSWSSTGKRFAAGSIAITDNRSMQYNMSRNLLVGDYEKTELQELVEHHVPRPLVEEADNPNALGAMRHTQDPRLFLTVTATGFSPAPGQEDYLFTAGTDKMLRRYLVGSDISHTRAEHAVEHAASVDLLAIHREGLIATGCHSASDSINVFRSGQAGLDNVWTGSPKRQDLQTTASIFPLSLKWGEAYVHRNFLLAGFSSDSNTSIEDQQLAGETALWDMVHQKQLEIKGTIRNVFDVCWNPRPSSSSVVFAVASSATGMDFSRRMRTAVSCFAPSQPLSAVVRWQCPALDINDVVICPYDNHLIAAGATDGKVYVWDQRWAGAGQSPLHVLSHDDSLNVLPHGYDKELTDTGVRFLSWGTTSSRLFSGSSDGVVKVWNPYRSADNAHVEDINVPRQHRSAIMSGTFSPDYRELLIGTENGRINVFKMGGAVRRPQQFKLHAASEPDANPHHVLEAANAQIKSRAIAVRPCGSMPIKQAVQGEFYQGPFQAPTSRDCANAARNLQQALDAQADLAANLAQQGGIDCHDPALLEKAQSRVRDAQAAIEDLQSRADFAAQSRPRAEAFQHSLQQSRKERKDLLARAREVFANDAGPCKSDCAYLPTSDELEDNRRSELRIPGVLRSIGNEELTLARMHESDQAAERCSKCFPLQAQRKGKGSQRELCLTCKLDRMRLTTVCSVCSSPARVETEPNKQPLCEACTFACFRCSGPVKFSRGARSLRCESCKLSWNAGVLGYELVTKAEKAPKVDAPQGHSMMPLYEQYDDLGALERERLAENWEC